MDAIRSRPKRGLKSIGPAKREELARRARQYARVEMAKARTEGRFSPFLRYLAETRHARFLGL